MTDNTNTPATPVAQVTPYQLMDTLGKVLFAHIEALVEAKVNQIMQSHATMALIDEKTEERLRNIAGDLITEHEHDHDHESRDDISDLVATHIHHYNFDDQIRRSVEEIISDGDYVTEERAIELAGDVCEEMDFEEKVKEVLRNL